ncbi:MAG: Non-canonical purine NTP pyrophosphatase [Candidatus Saccharibacteria bacterium GW2011_GWC2_48_9]|nr:MAG: Non-canonical purine NTP pyrophosphatase [Candidatus Saccharibacteria bacterium GW2011_GWC2_48_9]HCH34922.1 hypothetical protein [Candidatus Saccharibacteria bacterium]
MKQVHLLTGNLGKIKAANHIFNKYGIEVHPLALDIPEIQADTSLDVAVDMVKKAFNLTGKAVIREDHSFYIDELGIPGPFMAYVDKRVSTDSLLKILNTLSSRTGYFELSAAFADEDGKVSEFSYKVPIEFALEPKGDESQRWERLIKFPNDTKVFAEYNESERVSTWSKNYEQIAQMISISN